MQCCKLLLSNCSLIAVNRCIVILCDVAASTTSQQQNIFHYVCVYVSVNHFQTESEFNKLFCWHLIVISMESFIETTFFFNLNQMMTSFDTFIPFHQKWIHDRNYYVFSHPALHRCQEENTLSLLLLCTVGVSKTYCLAAWTEECLEG